MAHIRIDKWSWKNNAKQIQAERALACLFLKKARKDPLPCTIRLSPDSGFRLIVYPDPEVEEQEKHLLLAWLVRHFGGKARRGVRDSGKPYWALDQMKAAVVPSWPEGWIDPVVLMEDAALGKCRVVEVEKTIKVKELVCEA